MKLEILERLHAAETVNTPPLLFVHGASHSAWCWDEQFMPYFAEKGFHSYAVSFRGHGASEGHENINSYSLDDYVEDVLFAMQQLKAKPVLIAHSMGGAIVQRILQKHADQVHAVVFMASAPPTGMAKEWAKIVLTRLPKVFKMYKFNTKKSLEFPQELLFSMETPAEKRAEYVKRLYPESMRAAEDMVRQNIKDLNTSVPVLVLGSKQDKFFSDKIAVSVAKSYGTEAVIFPDVCHDMMLDPKWQTVADTILPFLHKTIS